MPLEAAACIGTLIVLLLLCIMVPRRERGFDERFPPITDDEFVARCTPGTSRHVALTVRRIVAEHLAVRYDQVHPSMTFIEDLGAD